MTTQTDPLAELRQTAVRAIHALKSPPPPGSQHYQSGWDTGLEAAIEAVQTVFDQAPATVVRRVLGTTEQADTEAAPTVALLAKEIPLGHSTPSHRVHGWCAHCPGRSVAEELAAWQVDALDRPGEIERLRTENGRMRHELEVMYGGAFDSPKPAPAAEAQQPTPAPAEEQPVIAYRDPNNPHTLFCRTHGERWAGLSPLTSHDLPHGGICTLGHASGDKCGHNVLAATEEPTR